PHKELVLYRVHEGVEFPASQHQQFSGRVQSDKDVLREGRIRLHVSRLRTEDSGLYLCDVMTDYGFNSGRCRLNVTASSAVFNHLKKDSTSDRKDSASDSRGRIGLCVLLGLTAALITV
uniref:Immunoglobulin V-set domain-containing protein n=1 Tax=Poecilia formosa TaxID=48698 RepID=A0A096M912_POEFO